MEVKLADLTAIEISELASDLDAIKREIFQSKYECEGKDRRTAVILAFILLDRIWLGERRIGIVKLCSFGMCGIWGLVDLFTAANRCDQYNRQKASEIIAALKAMSAN